MREMLTAVKAQPLVRLIYFNDEALVAEGLCRADPPNPVGREKDPREHDNHAHVDIVPPPLGPPEMITLPTGGAGMSGPAPTL